MIEIRDGVYIARMFMFAIDGMDVLGTLFRDGAKPWVIQWRFRYHDDDRVFDSADRKSFYRMVAGQNDDRAAKAYEMLKAGLAFKAAQDGVGYDMDELEIDSDQVEVITAKLATKDWVHMQSGAEAKA